MLRVTLTLFELARVLVHLNTLPTDRERGSQNHVSGCEIWRNRLQHWRPHESRAVLLCDFPERSDLSTLAQARSLMRHDDG